MAETRLSEKRRTSLSITDKVLNSLRDVNKFGDFSFSSDKISQQLELNDSFNL